MIARSSPLLRCLLLSSSLLLLLLAGPAVAQQDPALHQRIDAVLESGIVGVPASLSADHEFFRRIYLDLTGRTPTAEQLRVFLADTDPNKRARVIDQLLASPEFVRHMATSLDVMLMERRADKHVPLAEWQEYLYQSVATNKPLNQLFAEILGADSADAARRVAAKFLLDRDVEPNLLTRDVGRIVFGMDMQCAQCHDHPLIADYEQREYYGLFAFFQRSSLFLDAKDNNKAYIAESAEGNASFQSVFTKAEGSTLPQVPGGELIEDAVFAKDDAYIVKPDKDVRGVPRYSRRSRLAEVVARGDNRAFRRNLANRLWAHMMGRGLVDPVDLHHDDNPPAHPELLDLLADELAACQFNLRSFLRELALTRAYQRSIELPDDWIAIAAGVQAQIPALEKEAAAAESEYAAALDAVVQTSAAVEASTAELAPKKAELNAKHVAFVEAEKAARDSATAVTTTQQQLEAKQAIAQSLTEALAAAKRASELLPSEAALTDALAALQTQQDKNTAELTALEAGRPAQDQAVATANEALAAAQRGYEAAKSEWEQLSSPLRDLQAQAATAADVLRRSQNRLKLAERRMNLAQQLADAQPALESASAARERLTVLDSQRTALAAQIAALEQQIAAQQSSVAVSDATNLTAANTAALDTLKQQLADVTVTLESAANESASTLAAEQEILVALDEAWVQQAAAAPLKPLTPEQLAWSMMQASGVLERQYAASLAEIQQKPDAPQDPPQLATAVEKDVHAKMQGNVAEFVRLFGGGAGQPQNVFFATVDQALFFANGGALASWIAPSGNNLTDRLLKLDDPGAIAEELYLSVLTRKPTAEEVELVRQALSAPMQDKNTVIQELAWGLLTSAEFRFCP